MTDFTVINRLTVQIKSLQNELVRSENPEDIQKISRSIIELEHEIAEEKNKELRSFIEKKNLILKQITELESSLDDVNREINARINKFKASMISRMSQIETEYAPPENRPEVLDPPTM
jgi:uncharacterized protein Yka (UPF0111/DUF47 family)